MLKATEDSILYTFIDNDEDYKKSGSVILNKALRMTTRWVKAKVVGPLSTVKPGELLLVAYSIVSHKFEHEGLEYAHTSDKAVLLVKDKKGNYRCTCGTWVYEQLEEPEEVTASGIVLAKARTTKEMEPVWVRCFAAGPKAEIKKGELGLIAWKSDAYWLNVDGLKLRNAGVEEIIAIREE